MDTGYHSGNQRLEGQDMATKMEDELFRPYAPSANVVAVLQRIRRMNMPPKISREFLLGASLSAAIAPRVSAALRFLSLVDEEDRPSDTFKALASSTEDDYKKLLEQTIRTAYVSDFQNMDPATDPQQEIIDTFQRYTPKSQHSRQVMLLLGLCKEAGMVVFDSPRERPMQQRNKKNRTQTSTRSKIKDGTRATERRVDEARNLRTSELLFGVTEDDITALPEEDFNEVWTALGKVAKARAKAKAQRTERSDDEDAERR
jgi:hypothetical protein